MAGLGSFGICSVSAAAPTTPIPLNPQGDIYLCDSLLRNVSFKWTPVIGATGYTMQIATVSDFSSILINYSSPANSVFFDVNLVPGTYYWRVQSFNGDGSSSWSLPLSFHVIPSAPVLVYPSSNGFVLPQITFIWTTCCSPLDTQFQLSNCPNFSNILIDVNFNASQAIYKGPYVYEYKFSWPLSCGMYWWRVRTKLGTETSNWISQMFVVMVPPAVAPEIVAPSSNAIVSSSLVNLRWGYISSADRYQIQVCKGSSMILDAVISTTSYSFYGEDNTIYCAHVRAGNQVGWGPWSNWRQFKILLPPPAPRIIYPDTNTVFKTNSIMIDWTLFDTVEYWDLQIKDLNTGVNTTYRLMNNSYNFIGEYQHSYSARVKAVNQSGESLWSQSIWFKIEENIPPVINLDSYLEYTNKNSVVITGKAYDLESGLVSFAVNGQPIVCNSDGTVRVDLALSEGPNTFTFIAMDKAGNKTQKTIDIYRDTSPPEIKITFPVAPLYPKEDTFTVISDIKITGMIKDALPVTLLINNKTIPLDFNNFVFETTLNYSENKVFIKATDAAGNYSEKTLLIYKTVNPKFVFRVNNQNMFVQVIDKGKLSWRVEDIDPGRYTVPVIVKDRVFIPIRKIIELLGGSVEWDAAARKITIVVPARGKTIELWIGKALARVTDPYGNQQWIQIEKGDNSVVPFIKNGRSYFPLRFIAENLDAIVEWNQVLQQITIEFPIVP